MIGYAFDWEGRTHHISFDVPPNLGQQFANAPRTYRYTGTLPRDWKASYYPMFLNHAADQGPIRGLVAALKSAVAPKDNDELARACILFVQTGIGYDSIKAASLADSSMRYPSETLLAGHGVCADKTLLLAVMLRQLGYGIALLTWDRANHMALGIKVPAGFGSFGTPYAMVETTALAAVGQVPDKYVGGIRLEGRPEVMELGGACVYQAIVAQRKQEAEDERQYGKDYLKMNPAQQALHRQMQPLKAEMEALSQKLQRCQGTLPPVQYAECQALQTKYNALVGEYNQLVEEFNRLG